MSWKTAHRSFYYANAEPRTVFEEHVRAGRALAAGRNPAKDFPNSRDPGRRLRVGYISGDLWTHSVAFFIEPVLAAHDRRDVEVVCYSTSRRSDAVTARLRSYADRWGEVWGLDDAALARRIRADAIDVLVDLSGHTDDNRLSALAAGPAPVIATYLGYPNTTGVPAVAYRIVDAEDGRKLLARRAL